MWIANKFSGARKLLPQFAADVNIPVRGQIYKYITSDIVNGNSVNTQEVFQKPCE